MLFYVNDRLVPREEATVSVLDRGFIYGDGIFETLCIHHGMVFRILQHLKRLAESASIVRIRLPWTCEEIAEKILLTVRENGVSEGVVRVNISRGVGTWRLTTKGADHPTLVISIYPSPEYSADTFTKGWPIIISRDVMVMDPVIPARAKTTNRLNLIFAKCEAEERGAMEAILLNRNGHLTEGTTSNMFFSSRGTLFTPSEESGILWGITRDLALRIARDLGIELVEGFFEPSDLIRADEAFLTFTTGGVIPVHSVDGIVLGRGEAGSMTKRIMAKYQEIFERETQQGGDKTLSSVKGTGCGTGGGG
jgi:branched-chain amino acid aminotransferase